MHKDIAADNSPGYEGVAKPIVQHLIELRSRLLLIFGVMAFGTLISFFFVDEIYGFLVQPLGMSPITCS